jgi:hypothetical protein
VEGPKVTQTSAPLTLSDEKDIYARGRCRVRRTKVLARDDQGRLYAYEDAAIVEGVNDAARGYGGAG